MTFQLKHTKADAEGFKARALSEIKHLKESIIQINQLMEIMRKNFVSFQEGIKYCDIPNLIDSYEYRELEYRNSIIELNSAIKYAEERIVRCENNYKGWDSVSKECSFPINIEFILTTDGYSKRIAS